ncbi:hypothetical protein SNE40_014612 [Patella caerulea]|uniref:Uncharacterized protein n=1 Tax=Patella caerulea TaxID=87958 RepID=A0AAN8JG06_PATCE
MAQVRITRQDYDQETFDDIDDNDSNTSQEHIVQNLDIPDGTDHVFNRIQTTIENNLKKRNSTLSLLSSTTSDEETVQISDHYTSVPFDIQPRATYDHGRKNTDIIGVAYNGRMRQFVLLDAKGITTWKRDAVEHRVTRAYLFNKYEYRMFTHIIYVRKFNCYFVLTKEFSLKVLNRDFEETCSVSADLRSILFMLFNPLKDELITGGVGGTKFWTFHQVAENIFKDLKPMANYRLTLKYELPDVGGSWVKRIELDHHLEHLYCCSDTDLNVYNLHGKILFKFKKAHKMTITGCRYSMSAKVLVTSSVDCDVKVWSMTGGLVHTFRGHSRAVSNLILHPDNSSIIITSSLDGTIRMWSLETMEQLYSLVASSDGIMWMSLTDDSMLYICTCKHLTLWSLNYFYEFWSMARSKVTSMSLVGCPKKTTRIVTIVEDNSVRFFARKSQKNLSTVLPPPDLSPLEQISSMCYSREFNVAFLLIARNEQKTNEIWVYTTRTDPSCRMAVWDVREIQIPYLMRRHKSDTEGVAVASVFNNKEGPVYRATENGTGTESLTVCCCVCILNSTVLMMTEEGEASPIRQTYLLLGMEDGRVFFMDPVVKGLKYMEFKASKDAIVAMSHDSTHNSLVTISNLKYLTQIQIWTLPTLFLEHEVYCALDILRYTRINQSFLTGHENGCVNLYILEPVVDQGYIKTRSRTVIPELEDVVDVYKRPEHLESIMCLDSCQAMKIFCSSSVDGAIKIWDEQRLLLTEIMMDGSLSSVCFLNNKADLIMGFKNHIFYIDHTKVCPHLKPSGDEDDEFDKESVIYEDPAVSYEGIVANPDPIDLEHYLIPYEIEFSKDFLEGKPLWDSSSEEENEDSDLESLYSMAPTEIYFSPPGTPGELQDIDLIMRSEVTRNDLKKQMRSTMEHLLHRAYQINDVDMKGKDVKLEQQQHFLKLIRFRLALERNVKRKKKKKREDGTMSSDVDTDGDEELSRWRFNFPKFGQSPGPSPTLSILSTALSGVSDDDSDVSYEEVIGTDGKKRMKKKPKKKGFKPIEKIDIATSAVDVKKPKARYKGHYAEGESSGIGDVRLDVKTLLKKAAEAQKKEADHSHIRGEIDEHVSSVVRKHRDIQKKKVYKRRRPKQGQKLPNKPIPQTPVQIQDTREPSPEPEEEATEIKTQVTTEQDIIDDDDDDDTYPDTKPQLIYPHVDPISIPDLPQVPELPEKEPLARKISNPNKKTMIEFFDLQKPGIGVSPTTEIDQHDENNDISKKKVSVTSDGTRSIYSEYSEGDDLIPPVMMASPDPLSVGDEQEFRQGNLIQINGKKVFNFPYSNIFT